MDLNKPNVSTKTSFYLKHFIHYIYIVYFGEIIQYPKYSVIFLELMVGNKPFKAPQ